MAMDGLTVKQERFCLRYFELGNATEAARLAGYSLRTASSIAAENLQKPQIQKRLSELSKLAEDKAVATVSERKRRITELIRTGKITAEDIRPRDRIAAIKELNLMEHVYESRIGGDTQVTVVNILVRGEHMREMLAKVAERTGELLPAGRETPIAEASETEAEG